MSEHYVPAMDLPSISFSWFLDSMKIETDNVTLNHLIMVCETCQQPVCDVEDGDDLRTLFNTGLAHKCPEVKS